jgi:hypothetical protein
MISYPLAQGAFKTNNKNIDLFYMLVIPNIGINLTGW